MDSTPNEALPVRDVVVATRKVPMIEAVLGEETIVRPGNP